jgi:hypothetical protein
MIDLLKKVKEDPEVGYLMSKAVSQSALKTLDPKRGGSPKNFTQEYTSSGSRALAKGTAFHQFVLEPGNFEVPQFNRPSAKLGEIADYLIGEGLKGNHFDTSEAFEDACLEVNYGQSWTATKRQEKFTDALGYSYLTERVQNPNKQFITSDEYALMEESKQSLDDHEFATELLDISTHKEENIFFTIDGVECKARLDSLLMSEQEVIVIDLKTTGQSARDPWFIKKYGVDFQAAFYRRAALAMHKELYPNAMPPIVDCYTILAELKSNPEVVVYKLTDEKLNEQDIEIDSLINRYKFHIDNGFIYSMEELQNEHKFLVY